MIKKIYIILFLLVFLAGSAFAKVGLYGNPTPIVISKTRNSPVLVRLYDIDNTVFSEAEMAAITKVEIKYIPSDGAASESTTSTECVACFDWTTYAADRDLWIDIGSIAFTAGRDREAELLIYTADYTEGHVVGLLDIQISADAIRDATMIDPLVTSVALDDLNDVEAAGTDGQVMTKQADGSNAYEDAAAGGAVDMGAWGASSEITLVSGVAALSGEGYYTIDTESDDASDDLTQITGLTAGDEIVIAAEHNDRTVTVKAGTYFYIETDFILNNTRDRITLQCIGSNICGELSRRSGGD